MKLRNLVFSFIALFLCTVSFAQKKVVDEEAYAKWRRVDSYQMSQDGRFVTYRYVYIDNPDKTKESEKRYYLFDRVTKKRENLDSVSNLNFCGNGRWLLYGLGGKMKLRRLSTGKVIDWDKGDLPRFQGAGDLVSYTVNKGKDLVLRDLNRQDTTLFEGVQRVTFYENSTMILYLKETPSSIDLCYGKIAKGAIHKTIFRDTTKTFSVYSFSEPNLNGSFEVGGVLYRFHLKTNEVVAILDTNTIQLEAPLYLEKGSFTAYDRKYILFDVYPTKPEGRKRVDKSKKENDFELELWSWNDSISQNIQAVSGYREARMKPIVYVYDTENKSYYPVADSYTTTHESNDKTSSFIFLLDESPYAKFGDWEHDPRFDMYLVDLRNGAKRRINERMTHRPMWSKKGDYILFFDSEKRAWMSLNPLTAEVKDLSAPIGHPVHQEDYDKPNPVPSYGISGWSSDGKSVLINDQYDIWVVDVSGKTAAYCYTKEYGRKNNTVIRFVNPSDSELTIDLNRKYDVAMCDLKTMNMALGTISSDGRIVKHIEGPYAFKVLKSSDDATVYLYQRQNFNTDRDLWISDSKFKNPYKITDANPQQKEYSWGSVEIVEWTNYENKSNRGLLFLPENYQKGKSYPTIVNFYETHTEERHLYHIPLYSSAMLDVATYVSNGYIVFMPDVHFTIGKPGISSYNAVVSGTKALIDRGILDANRVGLQGHSWSGYQTAYLVTKTDLFRCVNIGAPIVNMTSAYNGIREGSGLPRMFMYEDWQCRMGATLWESLDQYIESSPVLYADKINTPVLLFHCDKDEAVSFSEGRSLFLALRRLQKPAWLLNYKGEGHFVVKTAAQVDWTKRMQQFFDHYLKGTAAPRWMIEGININERGLDQKYDLVTNKK